MNPKRLLNAGLKSDTPAGSTFLNRIILLCNVGVLLVNFFLALKMSDAQIGLLRSSAEAPSVRVVAGAKVSDIALPYTRVLQSLESVAPAGQESTLFTPEKLQAIFDAIRRYQAAIERGVSDLVYASEGQDLRALHAQLDKDAREEVEVALASRFRDSGLVQRLTTEVIRSCR